MGIRIKFILTMGTIAVLGSLAIGFASYKLSEKVAMDEAKTKGNIIFNYIIATRKFFKTQQKPLVHEIVAKDRFIPELMSGFSVTRGIWDKFNTTLSGYIFKQATLDPLYAPNKADAQEVNIINSFKSNPYLKTLEGILEKGEKKFYYLAFPIKVDGKKCLRCHGDPKKAPKDQVQLYGTTNGYNWKFGDVVSTFLIYVSVDKALEEAKKTAIILFGTIGGAILLALIILGLFMDRSVVRKIENLSAVAQKLSMGQGLSKSIPFDEKDEVGSLAHGIDRLRNSLNRLMRRR